MQLPIAMWILLRRSSIHMAVYSSLIRATVSSREQTPVIFKRLHLKCNLIICQIATKSLPLQLGDGGVKKFN